MSSDEEGNEVSWKTYGLAVGIVLLVVVGSVGHYLFYYEGFGGLEPEEQARFHEVYARWKSFDPAEFDSLVAGITAGKTDTYGKVESIFQWMNNSENMKNLNVVAKQPVGVKDFSYGDFPRRTDYKLFYGEDGAGPYFRKADPDAAWVYVTGYGRCREYAVLFDELAGRAGCESRIIILTYRDARDSHLFNEVRLENGTWVYVDASWPTDKPIGDPSDCDYLKDRGIDASRVEKIAVYQPKGRGEDLTQTYICKIQP